MTLILSMVLPLDSFGAGYVPRDGFFWKDGTAYLRKTVRVRTVDRRGCIRWVNQFRYIPQFTRQSIVAPEDEASLIVREVTRIAKQRARYGNITRLLEASGMSQALYGAFDSTPFTYGQAQGYAAPGYDVDNYGSRTTSSIDIRNHRDSVAALNMFNDGLARSQDISGDALDGARDLAQLESEQSATVQQMAIMQSTIDRMAQLVENTQERSARLTKTQEIRGPTGVHYERAPAAPGNDGGNLRRGVDMVIDQNCIGCHNSAVQPVRVDGAEVDVMEHSASDLFPRGVDLTRFWDWTRAQKDKALEAVTAGRMPPDRKLDAASIAMFELERIQQ